MTLQVALVGTDGIVLASDTRWIHATPVIHSSDSSKITISRERGIAVASARNMEVSVLIARKIIAELKDEDFQYPEIPIEKIAATVVSESSEKRRDAHCIIVFAGRPNPQLFWLEMAEVDGSLRPLCVRENCKAVGGERLSAAVFFTERYYEQRPVKELIPLAAQVICAGHALNNFGISGLEIVVCDESGFRHLSKDSIERLRGWASALDTSIEASLSEAQKFTYAPDVAG